MDRTKALYGPRTQAYGETNYFEGKYWVLDRIKALYGPRTQAYEETNYLKEKLQVLDRIEALYGPRTQTYGETNYFEGKYWAMTPLGRCMAYELCPMEGLPIDNWVNP